MRSALILLFCGLVAGAAGLTSACSDDGDASTLGVGGFGNNTGTGTGNGSGGDGGDMCPTDNCGACAAGTTCCNGVCVDLNSHVLNCGQCCKSCPNPNPLCEVQANDPPGDYCHHAVCNLADPMCAADQFCCDQVCCTAVAELCCPNGDGTYGCATPDATGGCP